MKKRYFWLSLVCLLTLAAPARAEFMMSEMIIDFAEKSPRQHDVEISSQSKETQYIVTETYVLENPGDPTEKRALINDPAKSGLLITPKKMELAGEAHKSMRFMLLKPVPDKEQIYRVVVKPVVGEIESEGQSMALKVLVGYEALVIVRPNNAKIELVAERKGNALTITNKGNSNAHLQWGNQCNATGGECKKLPGTRIYAGQSWTTTLPHMDGEAKYSVWDGTKTGDMSF